MRENPGAASMARIAAAAGVSRQAAYLHFENRAGLLLALVRWIDDEERIFDEFQRASTLESPIAVLEAYIRTWLGYLPRLHPVPGYLARAKDDPSARAAWNDRMRAMEELYARPLATMHRAKQLRRGLTVSRAVDLVRAIVSVDAWEHLVDDHGWSAKAASDSIWLAVRGALLR